MKNDCMEVTFFEFMNIAFAVQEALEAFGYGFNDELDKKMLNEIRLRIRRPNLDGTVKIDIAGVPFSKINLSNTTM